jgi:hypothetical protein
MRQYNRNNTIDADYIRQRELLIKRAELLAFAAAGPKPNPLARKKLDAWCVVWNRVFHNSMAVYSQDAGLTQ